MSCAHLRSTERPCSSGPHHAALICLDCGRHLRWISAPLIPERLNAYALPFGKFAGETLPTVDRQYLQWVAQTWDSHPKIQKVVRAFLEMEKAKT